MAEAFNCIINILFFWEKYMLCMDFIFTLAKYLSNFNANIVKNI